MQLDEAIQSRKSVRKFSDKKPDWRDIIECVDAARYAPMAGNIFSTKFILVDDKSTIQKLAEAAQQDFIKQADYVVVVCSDPEETVSSYEERGKKYLTQQAGAAIQNILLKIQETGLSSCWVGAFVDNIVKRELKIPDKIKVEALLPIGYESRAIGAKKILRKKTNIDRILYFNKYKNKKMRSPKTVKDNA